MEQLDRDCIGVERTVAQDGMLWSYNSAESACSSEGQRWRPANFIPQAFEIWQNAVFYVVTPLALVSTVYDIESLEI